MYKWWQINLNGSSVCDKLTKLIEASMWWGSQVISVQSGTCIVQWVPIMLTTVVQLVLWACPVSPAHRRQLQREYFRERSRCLRD